MGKLTMWFPNRADTNRPVQEMHRSLKFWIWEGPSQLAVCIATDNAKYFYTPWNFAIKDANYKLCTDGSADLPLHFAARFIKI